MAWGEPNSDAVQPPSAHGSGGSTSSKTAGRYGENNKPVSVSVLADSEYCVGLLNPVYTDFIMLHFLVCSFDSVSVWFGNVVGENHCMRSPCTHLCLLSALGPSYYSCACPSGWTLAADQITCTRGMHPAKLRKTLIAWFDEKGSQVRCG